MSTHRTIMIHVIAGMACSAALAQGSAGDSWRYYRPTNTGIQGDYNEAIWIGADGDPWIGGYSPTFEEGGFAKFLQAENRWLNFSNVDYPVIGHPNDTGTSRVSEFIADGAGNLWMATWRGALKFNPAIGGSSIVKYGPENSGLPGGGTTDLDLAPDGTIWFTAVSVFWGGGGVTRYNPATDTWTFWPAESKHIAVQPKPSGGYYVLRGDDFSSGPVEQFDSATQIWTTLPHTGVSGDVTSLPGKDCVDDAGNFWAWRIVTPGEFGLHYRRPDGTWVTPPQPVLPSVIPPVWAFRAFGDSQALLVDGNNFTWRFNGASWQNLGQWRPGAYTFDVAIDAAGSVWVCGVGGAAKRNPATGFWQRYRVTNTSQFDFFNNDLAIDQASNYVYACANAGAGIGGMVRFDGERWLGFNDEQYGLGQPWPFPTDNSESVGVRPSTGHVAVNPMFNGVREWTGSQFLTLQTGSTIKGFAEDSLGRLWSIGEYFNLQFYNGSFWTQVGIVGWGSRIQRDPERPGTIWATTGYEITRTDGVYRFSRLISDFPELNMSTDSLSGLAVGHDGIAWIGASVQFGAGGTGGALIRVDSNNGTYQMLRYDQGWPLPGEFVSPLAETPDGRLWMQYDSDFLTAQRGLCWYDGATVGVFPAPPGGEAQWGGLPHAAIKKLEVKLIPGGYELWMSCASRGIAVLTVITPSTPADLNGDGVVNTLDLGILLSSWSIPSTAPGCGGAASCPADLNGDGFVNSLDLGILLSHWTL